MLHNVESESKREKERYTHGLNHTSYKLYTLIVIIHHQYLLYIITIILKVSY